MSERDDWARRLAHDFAVRWDMGCMRTATGKYVHGTRCDMMTQALDQGLAAVEPLIRRRALEDAEKIAGTQAWKWAGEKGVGSIQRMEVANYIADSIRALAAPEPTGKRRAPTEVVGTLSAEGHQQLTQPCPGGIAGGRGHRADCFTPKRPAEPTGEKGKP